MTNPVASGSISAGKERLPVAESQGESWDFACAVSPILMGTRNDSTCGSVRSKSLNRDSSRGRCSEVVPLAASGRWQVTAAPHDGTQIVMRTIFLIMNKRSAAGFGVRAAAAAALVASRLLVPTSANQQQLTDARQSLFRARVNYIEVDVTVTDSRGRFVRDLRRQDFEVREDEKLQDVSSFALVDLPFKVRTPVATLVPRPSNLTSSRTRWCRRVASSCWC